MKLLELRAKLDRRSELVLTIIGFSTLLLLWSILSGFKVLPTQLLPTPWKVLASYPELHFKDALIRNLFYSVYLNVMGYLEAIIVSLFVGFFMGIFPMFRGLFSRLVSSARFIPMTAVTGLFIAWFGIETNMKIQFLAVGIMVYLIPVVVQRIDEIEEVYEQTAVTLGATPWQRVLHVYIPSVMAKISDDIRVLVAISWTYIIVAELINASSGGIGALTFLAFKQSNVAKAFAILIIIALVGFIQDKFFEIIDKKAFRYKYL
jgi:NitT/TauT family transport system permease protein